jgi:uncharacterized protein (DUF697 family)
VAPTDETELGAIPETIAEAVSVEHAQHESEENKLEPAPEDVLALEFAAERELSAMEIAMLEFAAETAAHDAIAAEVSARLKEQETEHTEMDEPYRSAMATVYKYSALSAATGLIPVPLVDMAGFMAMQLMMLKKLCAQYNIPFDSQRSKSAIAILASGISSTYLAASSSKLVPFIGAFSIAAMPAVNGAFSYAVGRVFIRHFASGGTFLDFDPVKVRGYFEEQFRVGKLSRTEKL